MMHLGEFDDVPSDKNFPWWCLLYSPFTASESGRVPGYEAVRVENTLHTVTTRVAAHNAWAAATAEQQGAPMPRCCVGVRGQCEWSRLGTPYLPSYLAHGVQVPKCPAACAEKTDIEMLAHLFSSPCYVGARALLHSIKRLPAKCFAAFIAQGIGWFELAHPAVPLHCSTQLLLPPTHRSSGCHS